MPLANTVYVYKNIYIYTHTHTHTSTPRRQNYTHQTLEKSPGSQILKVLLHLSSSTDNSLHGEALQRPKRWDS